MSIVAVISSPRKGGNCDTVVNAIVDSAKANGKDVKVFYLNPMTNRKGCQACNGCKKAGRCIVHDDLTPVLDAIRDSEGVILSSPVYFREACGQYRLLEDRFFSFLNADFSLNIKPGKKVAIVTSCGGSGAQELADKIEGVMCGFMKFEPVGKIVITGGNALDTAKNNKEIMSMAKDIGKKF